MKLSVAVSTEQAPDNAFVVWRGIERSIDKAHEFGYHGVELALRDAGEADTALIERALLRTGLEISAISTGQVFAVLGLYFTHPDADARAKVIGVFKGLTDLAAEYAPIINVGRARGFVGENQTPEAAEALFIETVSPILDYAEKKGVTVIIEPVNRYEINFVNSLGEGSALLEKLPYANIGLMPDLFHMNIEEPRIEESLIRHAKWVKYVHFADSNRHAPGQGHIDFDAVFAALSQINFDGWASVEILPYPDPDTAAKQAADYLLPRIGR